MKILLLSILLIFLSLSSLIPTSSPCPTCPTPKPPPPPKPKPSPKPCPPPPTHPKTPPTSPTHPKTPPTSPKCPIDTLKLAACVDVLSGLAHAVVGEEATRACCPVVSGLTDADAALCLCTTIKAKLLDVNVFLPIALEMLVDCGKHAPEGYQCPA